MQSPHLIVPGWNNSEPAHWQSVWQAHLGAPRIELAAWNDPRRESWTSAIEAGVAALAERDPRPPVLIAHSLGCIAVAQWARMTRRRVRAAFLVAPADVERGPCAPRLFAFGPVPTTPLPFDSSVIASDDDPFVELERAQTFARGWGSELFTIRGGGHLNAASNLGPWRYGRALLAQLLSRADLALSA